MNILLFELFYLTRDTWYMYSDKWVTVTRVPVMADRFQVTADRNSADHSRFPWLSGRDCWMGWDSEMMMWSWFVTSLATTLNPYHLEGGWVGAWDNVRYTGWNFLKVYCPDTWGPRPVEIRGAILSSLSPLKALSDGIPCVNGWSVR